MTVRYIGAFPEYYLITVDGYHLPYIKIYSRGEKTWTLSLDDRYSLDIDEKNIQEFVHFLANAMAISAGYSSFGEQSKQINPFRSLMYGLSSEEIGNMKGGDYEDNE